jgi:hypothetical protein
MRRSATCVSSKVSTAELTVPRLLHLTLSLPERRFPPPWSIEDNGACFIVKDHGGQTLAYVYYEDEV